MKRLLILLFAAMMAFTMAACSSTKETAAPPKAVDSAVKSQTPAPTPTPTPSPSPAPDTVKGTEVNPPADAAKPEEAKTPEASTKPEESKSSADAPKAADAKPTETPKAEEPKPAAETPKQAEAPKAEAPKAEPAAPAPAPEKPEISAQGKKVLLVGRENAAEDIYVAGRLKALGFKVTIMIDREFTAAETKGYDLIYISQTLNSKIIKDGVMKDVAIPTVYVKNHGMFYLGLSSIEENANIMNVKSIDIVDSKHKVAGGLSGAVEIYKETSSRIGIGYGLPSKEAKIIATGPGDKSKATIYYYDKGSKADNGYEAKARISFFFLNNGMQENTTEAGWKLLDNLVLWTLQNG
ncbi:hypothetical protein [Paenibacillus rigui]|uniref:Uncharacterized protein n=1 Tax=Paenibacillus rigui TaxID=554312 RepID=A0A229UX07_9BACL|nr:hypothetical protein [Paenibacillus rigui]OXM87964.1 hypothetical protein CF651_02365 [Paenibacillus rigui]